MSSLSPASPPSHKNNTKPLPPGWKWVKLGDVTNVVNGTTPASENKLYWNGDIVWITPTDLGKLDLPEITNSERRITSAGFKHSNLTLVPPGTVVLSSRAPIGYLGIATIELCTNQGCKSFIPGSEIDTYYLYFTLKKSVPKLKEIGRGPTFNEISKSQCERFDIPMPLLSEQKRIAAILKEQLTAIDKARKAAEERLAAVKALPAAFLRRVFPHPGQPLPEGWKWVKLGEVIRLRCGEFLPSSKMGSMGMFPVYGGNGITGYHDSYMLEEEKVIIGRVGALCGCVHIAKPKSWITDNALYIDIKKIPLNNEYLLFLLTNMNLHRKANQMGVPVISSSSIYELIAPFPPLNEQQHIAAILMEQIAGAEKARIAAEGELATINSLPAAILRKAFNGEI